MSNTLNPSAVPDPPGHLSKNHGKTIAAWETHDVVATADMEVWGVLCLQMHNLNRRIR
jgi:hypothetical protein